MNALRVIRFSVFTLALVMASRGADVLSLGAKGDGRTDDTEAIQRAVDGGGNIPFPSGIFRLTRTIRIDLDKTGFIALTGDGTARIVMAGAGPAFQFIGTHAGSAAPDTFKSNVWERQRTPRVDGLEIIGAHPEADAIAGAGTMQLTITRVVIREARHAIRLHERNRNVLISDCHLYHNRGIGVFLDAVNLHQINVTGSHISYNAGGGMVVRGGNVRNIHIGNCDIESNMSRDAPPTANVLLDCTGGSVGEVAITGCTIQHTANAPGSANIRVIGAGENPATARTPATPTNEGHITITGNVLSDVQVNVHLQHARGVTLTGNTFWMGFAHDLLVEDCSNIVVGPNNLDRNPRYEFGRNLARGGVAFLRSRDCTITGLHINGVRHHDAAVLFDGCSRLNISNATVLDSDGTALSLHDTRLTHVSGCVLRDDRAEANPAPALKVVGGQGNTIVNNIVDRPPEIARESGTSRDNEVVARAMQ
jgi:hypothetical protein